jgi:zinc D-Ala-D-Ala carboxypeptidase
MNISKHFTLAELTYSETADRHNIDNSADSSIIKILKTTAEKILEPARINFGIPFRPNSCYRGEKLEKQICWGGDNINSSFAKWCKRKAKIVNEESWASYFALKTHPQGFAVDFEIAGVSNYDLALWLSINTPSFHQIILEFYLPGKPTSGWVHASYINPEENKEQLLTINKYGNKIGLTP